MPYSPNPTPLPAVLAYLRTYQAKYGYCPSTREIAEQFGKSQLAARYWINQLIEQGHASRDNPRNILTLTNQK